MQHCSSLDSTLALNSHAMASPPEQNHILLTQQAQTPTSSSPSASVLSIPSSSLLNRSGSSSAALSTANIGKNSPVASSIPKTQSTTPFVRKDKSQQPLDPPPPSEDSLFSRGSPFFNDFQPEQQDPRMQDDYLGSPAAHTSTVHSTTTRGDNGSRSPLLYHRYVRSPFQSFIHYLSSADRESPSAKASFPPLLRRLPPWLLPQYHLENDDALSPNDSRNLQQQGRRGRRPQWTRGRVVRSAILGPLCRLLILWVVLAILIAATIVYSFRPGQPELSDYVALTSFDWTPINPRSYLSPMNATFGNQYDVLLDGHSHTVYSDGRMSPETLIKWHIANGYNAFIVSDHNTIEGGLATQKLALEKYAGQVTVIPAMELSCCRLHMNLIGINETIDIAITKWPTDEQLTATIARTHELGGLAIINHIPWSNTTEYGYELPRMQNHPSREALVEMGIDGFEIANGGTLDTISLKFIQDNNLLLITGTDVHYPDTNAFAWTILNTNNNRSVTTILNELKARRTSFLFDPTGTQPLAYPPESKKYYRTAPPTLLGQYFQMFWNDQTGMYSFMPTGGFCHIETITVRWSLIGYFIGWILVAFLIFEAARLLLVGCCWGPFQRRKRYLRRKKGLENERAVLDEESDERDEDRRNQEA